VTWQRQPPPLELENLWAEGDGRRARRTGEWALHKLAILSNYFRFFNIASQKSGTRSYVDGFAGPGLNWIQARGRYVYGSPLLAARTNKPQFTNLLLMEQHSASKAALQARFPHDPRVRVLEGDCNESLVPAMHQWLSRRAPTLCVLDPNGVELRWNTVEQVSAFRQGSGRKTELLITFARNMALLRLLRVRGDIDPPRQSLIDSFFGTREWEEIYEQRVAGRLEPREASEQYLQLYEKRLRSPKNLGYKHVFSTMVRKRGDVGGPLYCLTFATDDDGGRDIMQYIFEHMNPLNPQLTFL